jgi:hypothetical protein
MGRNKSIAIRNDHVSNQIDVDFSACGVREDIKEKQGVGSVCPLSSGKIWAVRGSVAPDREEVSRMMEQEMLRAMAELEAEEADGRPRLVVIDKVSVNEKTSLILEEFEALLFSDTDKENPDRKRTYPNILTQEEIDALLDATDPEDTGNSDA